MPKSESEKELIDSPLRYLLSSREETWLGSLLIAVIVSCGNMPSGSSCLSGKLSYSHLEAFLGQLHLIRRQIKGGSQEVNRLK